MHHTVTAETVYEVQAFDVWRRTDDGMMIGSHFIETGPGASWIHFGFGQHGHARSGMRQDFLHESLIEVSLESRRFFGIIPSEQNALPFATKMKPSRHVDDHGKPLWKFIEWLSGNQLATQRLNG